MATWAIITPSQFRLPIGDRRPGSARSQPCLRWGCLFLLILSLLGLGGCAEVTEPTPTASQKEAVQLAAAKRHPCFNWSTERVARVFLRLLPYLPQTLGRTYPFLGFNWWVTATGQVAIDQVWYPSPAQEAGLKQGDVILAVNNWPIPAEVATWDKVIKTTHNIFQDFLLTLPVYSYEQRSQYKRSQQLISMWFPGELLPAIMLDLKHIAMEARGRYLTGPVELLIQRDNRKFTKVLYPQLLPAEYSILVDTTDHSINAYAAPGKIILTQRLVSLCLNDDELALVVGHEMAHQVLGHLVRGAAYQELGTFLGEAVTAVSTLSLNRLLDWRHTMVSPDVRQVVGNAVVSVFSQDEEREADIYGAWFAYQAGYNIDKGAAIWERVAAVEDHDPFAADYFLDSHPPPLERLARLKLIAQYFRAGRAAEVFLQSPDLNRRPPPRLSKSDDGEALTPAPPAPAPPESPDSLQPVGLRHREREAYPGFAGNAVHPDLRLIKAQEPAHHEQPQAGPVLLGRPFGGKKGFKDPG
jgi:Zn-dependent protease with chaperone function